MFLPVSREDMEQAGWDQCDVIMVTGDAYVDHPSFGAAVISRYLESKGFKVGIIAQPDTDDPDSVSCLGRPRLFWGVTAGNVDSIIANYTASGKIRNDDPYSPDNSAFRTSVKNRDIRRRPDRAVNVYTEMIRRFHKGAFVVAGGIEASLRRFSHWDYLQGKIRHSLLVDSKADMLVYGMGERAAGEIAGRLARGEDTSGIRGTVIKVTADSAPEQGERLPAHADLKGDPALLLEQNRLMHRAAAWGMNITLSEEDGAWAIIQNPPASPLSQDELDALYDLPFEREPHPMYSRIPAFDMIKFSITAHRGCGGGCSFCGIGLHQGKLIRSRSSKSIMGEVDRLMKRDDFRGHITDVGGPSADMYGARCAGDPSRCTRRSCFYPSRCPNLKDGLDRYMKLLEAVASRAGRVTIGSGLRLDLSLRHPRILEQILKHHISGYLNVAPEHISPEVLEQMGKFKPGEFVSFVKRLKNNPRTDYRLRPYFIAGHPGETVKANRYLTEFLGRNPMDTRAVQCFVPTPGTYSTALFAGRRDSAGRKLHVPSPGESRRFKENIMGRGEKKRR